ncbi:MAG: putative PEP-binding protein [Alphaproteobacteria bacterium]|jgi:hypothetical protein|nr:putative PEP-binding protein [Alphaproteobacteria bacterium]
MKPPRKLAPCRAAIRLDEGLVPPTLIYKDLDVEACQFFPTLDDQGQEPLLYTGVTAYGPPAAGYLAFTLEDVEQNRKTKRPTILVVGFDILYHKFAKDKKLFEKVNGLILVTPNGHYHPVKRHIYEDFCDHFAATLGSRYPALIDSFTDHHITYPYGEAYIKLRNGTILQRNDAVSIDPMRGALWRGLFPIRGMDNCKIAFVRQAILDHDKKITEVFLHEPDRISKFSWDNMFSRDFMSVASECCKIDYRLVVKAYPAIGLIRNEVKFVSAFLEAGCDMSLSEAFTNLTKGAIPNRLEYFFSAGFYSKQSQCFRLVDLSQFKDQMPEEMKSSFQKGLHHIPETKSFQMRSTLYGQQAYANTHIDFPTFLYRVKPSDGNTAPQYIVIPDVTNPREMAAMAKVIRDNTPDEYRHLVKIAVMMEHPKALKWSEALAEICDGFCYGTNDLTSYKTGLARTPKDLSSWMKEHGYKGRSPFEVLIPPVADDVEDSFQRARRVKPDLFVNMCGQQTAGQDIASIERVLRMRDHNGRGVDRLTVPPRIDYYLRARLVVERFHARQNKAG